MVVKQVLDGTSMVRTDDAKIKTKLCQVRAVLMPKPAGQRPDVPGIVMEIVFLRSDMAPVSLPELMACFAVAVADADRHVAFRPSKRTNCTYCHFIAD